MVKLSELVQSLSREVNVHVREENKENRDATLVIESSGLVGRDEKLYLPVKDDEVALPKEWAEEENLDSVSPSKRKEAFIIQTITYKTDFRVNYNDYFFEVNKE